MTNPENKRKTARAYPLKPTEIVLKGKAYRLNDISSEGLGIIVEEDAHTFFMGQRIDQIPLQLEQGTEYLKGVVAHLTKNELNSVCGIRFLFGNRKEFESVQKFQKEISTAA
jgi:hypothetical protein